MKMQIVKGDEWGYGKLEIKLIEEKRPLILGAVAGKISQYSLDKKVEEIIEEIKKKGQEEIEKYISRVMGYGHLVLGEIEDRAIVFDKITRAAALFLWSNVSAHRQMFGAGVEASFRIISPKYFHPSLEKEFVDRALKLYYAAIDKGTFPQDARYVLPEGTQTRIIFAPKFRYIIKLANAFKQYDNIEEFKEIGERLTDIVKGAGWGAIITEELPSEVWEILSDKIIIRNRNEDKKNKRKSSIRKSECETPTLCIKGLYISLSALAQLVRERMMFAYPEPLSNLPYNAEFVIPKSFEDHPDIVENYKELAKYAVKKQRELLDKGDPNFIYYLLMGQVIKVNIEGWRNNPIIQSASKRGCGVAQHEIRGKYGVPLIFALYYGADIIAGPPCVSEGICTEPSTFKKKFSTCELFPVYLEMKKHEKSLGIEDVAVLKANIDTFYINNV